MMELLLDLGIIGSTIGVLGDEKGIPTMVIQHKNGVNIIMLCEKQELLKLLKSQIHVAVKVNETMSG